MLKLFEDCKIACEVEQLKAKASWQDLVKLRGCLLYTSDAADE